MVQVTPRWQKPVGTPQDIRPRELDWLLIKQRGITNQLSEGGSNKKLIINKEFKAGLLDIKDRSDVQFLLSQFKINAQGLGCIFWRNYVYYVTFLSYLVELPYPIPPEKGKEKDELQRNFVSTSATSDLHMYFLRGSAINCTLFIFKKTRINKK